MAKLERTLTGDFDALLDYLHDGILSGSASGLEPQGTATRAQAAAMLVRFTQTVSK